MKIGLGNIAALLLLLLIVSCGVFKQNPNSGVYRAMDVLPEGLQYEGTLEERFYDCSDGEVTRRRMMVYLPASYKSEPERRYPVLYLLHGARGYETSWIVKGDILRITDSLVRRSEVKEYIIVMPNVNQYDNDADCDDSRIKDAFEATYEIDGAVESAFVRDVVTFVDSCYRTVPDCSHRAVAGLSIGALQALWLSANFPGTFGYVGLFSPMLYPFFNNGEHKDFYKGLPAKMERQFSCPCPPEGYYLMIGQHDFLYETVFSFHLRMLRKGWKHSFVVSPGGHDWDNWTNYYILMMKDAFR